MNQSAIDFKPSINKIHPFDKHSLLLLNSGQGSFEVDFRTYSFTAGKAIFLSPGQYFRLLSGEFDILLFEFANQSVGLAENSRFLFNHLVGLGQIDTSDDHDIFLKPLKQMDMEVNGAQLLSSLICEWTKLNPFNASSNDVNLLFDLKELVDQQFQCPINLNGFAAELKQSPYRISELSKAKLGKTVHKIADSKLLLESTRKIVFTNLPTKEIAYQLGFKDPTYFNAFFKNRTGKAPSEYRDNYNFKVNDPILDELFRLIDQHYKDERLAAFYAAKLFISEKTLYRKLDKQLGTSLGQLIREKKLREAMKLLKQNVPVYQIAFELNFKEPNHLSAMFKNYTGKTPQQYIHSL